MTSVEKPDGRPGWQTGRKVQKPDVITKKFTSKSNPDITYTSKKTMLPTGKVQYSCNCPGVWRAKSRECKHIKEMKKN